MVIVVNPETVGVGVLLAVAAAGGLYLLYRGFTYLSRGWTIWRNDPVDAGSVHLESGIVEVQGEVELIDGQVLSSKYTNRQTVAYDYKLEEKQRKRTTDGADEWEWKTVDSGSVANPFYVADETGRVAVDPDGATVTLDSERVSSHHRERQYEGRLEPGDHVHVYGQKREATDGEGPGGESVFIGDGDETDGFTVSDTTEFRTFLRYAGKGIGMVVLAALALGVAAFLGPIFLEQTGLATVGLVSLRRV